MKGCGLWTDGSDCVSKVFDIEMFCYMLVSSHHLLLFLINELINLFIMLQMLVGAY